MIFLRYEWQKSATDEIGPFLAEITAVGTIDKSLILTDSVVFDFRHAPVGF
jgi:hypothetical protein